MTERIICFGLILLLLAYLLFRDLNIKYIVELFNEKLLSSGWRSVDILEEKYTLYPVETWTSNHFLWAVGIIIAVIAGLVIKIYLRVIDEDCRVKAVEEFLIQQLLYLKTQVGNIETEVRVIMVHLQEIVNNQFPHEINPVAEWSNFKNFPEEEFSLSTDKCLSKSLEVITNNSQTDNSNSKFEKQLDSGDSKDTNSEQTVQHKSEALIFNKESQFADKSGQLVCDNELSNYESCFREKECEESVNKEFKPVKVKNDFQNKEGLCEQSISRVHKKLDFPIEFDEEKCLLISDRDIYENKSVMNLKTVKPKMAVLEALKDTGTAVVNVDVVDISQAMPLPYKFTQSCRIPQFQKQKTSGAQDLEDEMCNNPVLGGGGGGCTRNSGEGLTTSRRKKQRSNRPSS